MRTPRLITAGVVACLALPLTAQMTAPADEVGLVVASAEQAVPPLLAETIEKADRGDLVSLVRLSRAYRLGEAVDADLDRSLRYDGRIVARWSNINPRAENARHVVEALLRLAEARPRSSQRLLTHAATYFGAPEAQFRLGGLLLGRAAGDDVRERRAARWLLVAARKGHHDAQKALGGYLLTTRSEAGRMKGRYWLEAAAQAGGLTQPVSGHVARAGPVR